MHVITESDIVEEKKIELCALQKVKNKQKGLND